MSHGRSSNENARTANGALAAMRKYVIPQTIAVDTLSHAHMGCGGGMVEQPTRQPICDKCGKTILFVAASHPRVTKEAAEVFGRRYGVSGGYIGETDDEWCDFIIDSSSLG